MGVGGGGNEPERGGCVGWWWWEEKCFRSLFVDVAHSHLQDLPTSFLGRRLHSQYVGQKISMYNNAFVV